MRKDQKDQRVRRAAVSGRFYPAEPSVLRHDVEKFIAEGETGLSSPRGPVKGIIAPHAGYVFSGPIAGSAYAALARDRKSIRRIVLVGPAHFVGFEGMALSSCTALETPLGTVPVDMEAVDKIIAAKLAVPLDEAHEREHSLEVHLPFLQVALGDFKVVPLLAGEVPQSHVAKVLELLWGGDETRFVISSDLSHFLQWNEATVLDKRTAQSIEQLQPDELEHHQACGRLPICGMLLAAKAHGLAVAALDLRNSGDTSGPRDRVVGYGAFSFTGPLNAGPASAQAG